MQLKLSENIALEGTHSAEEPLFRKRQRIAVVQLLLYELDRAYKVGNLEQLVVLRPDVLRELGGRQTHG